MEKEDKKENKQDEYERLQEEYNIVKSKKNENNHHQKWEIYFTRNRKRENNKFRF